MTAKAKDYLEHGLRLDNRINSKIEQLAELNALAARATSTLSGMPHSPNGASSGLENVIMKIVTLQEEINADIDRLVDLKLEIMEKISQIEDTDLRMVLEYRYLCEESFPDIAVKMNLSARHPYYLHELALKAFQTILGEDSA